MALDAGVCNAWRGCPLLGPSEAVDDVGPQDLHQHESGRGHGVEEPMTNRPPDPGLTGDGVYPWGPQVTMYKRSGRQAPL
jgi:hypothetical protein